MKRIEVSTNKAFTKQLEPETKREYSQAYKDLVWPELTNKKVVKKFFESLDRRRSNVLERLERKKTYKAISDVGLCL